MKSYNRWKEAVRASAFLASGVKRAGGKLFVQHLPGMDCIWFLD